MIIKARARLELPVAAIIFVSLLATPDCTTIPVMMPQAAVGMAIPYACFVPSSTASINWLKFILVSLEIKLTIMARAEPTSAALVRELPMNIMTTSTMIGAS